MSLWPTPFLSSGTKVPRKTPLVAFICKEVPLSFLSVSLLRQESAPTCPSYLGCTQHCEESSHSTWQWEVCRWDARFRLRYLGQLSPQSSKSSTATGRKDLCNYTQEKKILKSLTWFKEKLELKSGRGGRRYRKKNVRKKWSPAH